MLPVWKYGLRASNFSRQALRDAFREIYPGYNIAFLFFLCFSPAEPAILLVSTIQEGAGISKMAFSMLKKDKFTFIEPVNFGTLFGSLAQQEQNSTELHLYFMRDGQ